MDSRKIVFRETAIIAIGEFVGSAIMVGVFALLNLFSMKILWSALCGCITMIGNYFFMAVTVSLAADRAEKGNMEQGKKMIHLSSAVRLVVMLVILLIARKLGANIIALALPLLFARPTLMLSEFFRKKGD